MLQVFVSSELHSSFAALVGESSDSTSANAGIEHRSSVGERGGSRVWGIIQINCFDSPIERVLRAGPPKDMKKKK